MKQPEKSLYKKNENKLNTVSWFMAFQTASYRPDIFPETCINYIRKGPRIGCLLFPETTDCPVKCTFFTFGKALEASPEIQIDCQHLNRHKGGDMTCLVTEQIITVICEKDCSKFLHRLDYKRKLL